MKDDCNDVAQKLTFNTISKGKFQKPHKNEQIEDRVIQI